MTYVSGTISLQFCTVEMEVELMLTVHPQHNWDGWMDGWMVWKCGWTRTTEERRRRLRMDITRENKIDVNL